MRAWRVSETSATMPDPFSLAVLIPSLHPDQLLVDYAQALSDQGQARILVVDDGSGPAYAPVFAKVAALARCEVIGYAENHGKGYALKYGMRHIRKHYAGIQGIVTADSDGQHTVEDVAAVRRAMMEKDHGLFLGTRDFKQGKTPFKSAFGNRLTSFFFLLLYGQWLPDTQTGLRGFHPQLSPLLEEIPGERFEYEMNMLIQVSGRGIPFYLVPINTIYIEENKSTHFRPLHDSMRIYAQLFRNFFKYASASFVSTVLDIVLFTLLAKSILPRLLNEYTRTVLWGLPLHILLATALARICSALFNYKANKSFVFRASHSKGAMGRYMALVIAVMAASASGVSLLHSLGMDVTLAKVLVDTTLFMVNYRIQKSWVFAQR